MLSGSKFQRRQAPVALIAGAVFLLLGLAGPLFAQANPRFVTIGTASAAGAYYPLGVEMAQIWNQAIPGTHFAARETGGSIANMNLLASGQIQVGMANENIAYAAVKGKSPFTHPINVMGGWILNESLGIFVALRSSGYTSVSDLQGKRISLGSPGSSGNDLGKLILEANGLAPGSYKPAYLGWQESADALKDHFIDAAFFVGGSPFPAVSSLAVTTPIALLDFDVSKVRTFSNYPYASTTIPKAMYNLNSDGKALAVRSIVYLSPSLPKGLVYQMVKAVFANIPALKAAQASGGEAALLSKAAAADLDLTMQPGIVQYEEELGKW